MAYVNPTFTPEELQQEVWKPIPEWEGFYEVSSLGRVRRIVYICRSCGEKETRPLKPVQNKDHYPVVTLNNKGRQKLTCIHVLVASAFYGPRPSLKHEVNHINHVKSDNRLENLEWVTASENIRHALNMNRMARVRGITLIKRKLSEENVRTAHRLLTEGHTCVCVAERFNVTPATIGCIRRGKSWCILNLSPLPLKLPKPDCGCRKLLKLTPDDVTEIRRAISSGDTQTAIAKRFGISLVTVSAIKTRRNWKHLP